LSEVLRPLGQPLKPIAVDSSLVAHDDVSISGFPWEYQNLRIAQASQGFSSFSVSGLQVVGNGMNEVGLLTFEWVAPDWPMFNVDPSPGRFQPAGPALDPSGMSGGGAWRYKRLAPESSALWSPSELVKMIGIQRSWNPPSNHVFVEPVERWGTWALEMLETIDSEGH
jgi:hypothetical protein